MNMWTWMDIKLSVSKKKTSLFPLESPPPPKSGPHLGLVVGTFPTASPKAGSIGQGAQWTWASFASLFLALLKSGHFAGALAPHTMPSVSLLHFLIHPHCCSLREHSLDPL